MCILSAPIFQNAISLSDRSYSTSLRLTETCSKWFNSTCFKIHGQPSSYINLNSIGSLDATWLLSFMTRYKMHHFFISFIWPKSVFWFTVVLKNSKEGKIDDFKNGFQPNVQRCLCLLLITSQAVSQLLFMSHLYLLHRLSSSHNFNCETLGFEMQTDLKLLE